MTEHSKIPVPPKKDKPEKSLFERSEGLFAGKKFKPAPVPRDLAPPANRQVVKRRPVPQAAAAAPARAPEPVAASAESRVEPPVVAERPAQAMLPRLAFDGEVRHIDRELLERNGMINPAGLVTGLLEEFRIVKRQLLKTVREGHGPKAQRILVCSPLPDEGKTYCATNLALAMAAERDCEILLVDADVAKPSILSLLGLPKGPGLMDALANPQIAVEDCVITTDIAGLYVLPAGNQTNADSEYLSSKRTAEVLDRLTQGAADRVLIFDSPPALAASPAADLANHVGQALVVARADKTGQSALEDALTLLSTCPDIKLLLNDANFSPSGRRFGAYYGYGA